MGASALTLTVFFEDPFWVGTFERYCGGALCVAKVTFGAEPKDSEVYAAWLGHWNELEFSPPLRGIKPMGHAANPKRMQRAAAAEVKRQGIGSKRKKKNTGAGDPCVFCWKTILFAAPAALQRQQLFAVL